MYNEKKIKIPIYQGDFYIINTNDTAELNRRHDLIIDEIFAHSFLSTPLIDGIYLETYYAIFDFSRPDGCKPEIDDLAHEAFHLTGMVMNQKDIKYDPDNDEPFAYLVGWFMRELVEYLYEDNNSNIVLSED